MKRNAGIPISIIFACMAVFTLTILPGCSGRMEAKRIADLGNIEMPTAENTSQLYDVNGKKLADLSAKNREYVAIKDIPPIVQQSFIAIEDERFFKHSGVDSRGVVRSFVRSLMARRYRQGASTITMQLARTLYLSQVKTIERKTKEIYISIELEKKYTKQEILEAYLNHIYFGHGAYGVSAAAKMFYGKELNQLTIAESAMLAAVVNGPSIYSPYINPSKAIYRRNLVLKKLYELKYISQDDYTKSINEDVHLIELKSAFDNFTAPYFVDFVINELTKENGSFQLTPQQLFSGGYRIVTTLDIDMQRHAEDAVRNGVIAANLYLAPDKSYADNAVLNFALRQDSGILGVKSEAGYTRYLQNMADDYCAMCSSGKKDPACGFIMSNLSSLTSTRWRGGCPRPGTRRRIPLASILHARQTALSNPRVGQGALTAVDSSTGGILAMVGGVNYGTSRYNRAWLSARQAGSSFKPFVYLTAVEQGRSMYDTVQNSRYCLGGYCPKNYGGGYGNGGSVTLHEALVRSLNIPAVRVGVDAGIDNVIELCQNLGITSELDTGASLALGTASITPLQMAGAYAAISNGGYRVKPFAIKEIRDRSGKLMYTSGDEKGRRVIKSKAIKEVVPAMQDVVRRGTGTRANFRGQAAGKTGTTSNYRDAWFVGFTPGIAASVWIGNDDNKPLCSKPNCRGTNMSGGYGPAPIWRDFMKYASVLQKKKEFNYDDLPEDVEEPATGESVDGSTATIIIDGGEPGGDEQIQIEVTPGEGDGSGETTVPAPVDGGETTMPEGGNTSVPSKGDDLF